MQYLKSLWAKFEAWVNSWFPGLKTKIVTAAGALGSAAAMIVAYMQSVPLDQVISAKTLALSMLVANTLAFWLRGIADRVQSRATN